MSDPVDERLNSLLADSGDGAAPSGGQDPVEARLAQIEKQGKLDEPEKMDKGKFSAFQAGLHMATGGIASIGAGYRGLYDLATGKGADAAANDVQDTQQRFTTDTNQATADELESDKNPLTWIPKGAKWAGNKTLDLTGSPLLATGVETGLNAAGMYAGNEAGGALGSAVSKGTRAGVDILKTARRGDIPANAQAVADDAMASQSRGAAARSIDTAKLTPETQTALADMKAKRVKADPEALARIQDAETLPEPVRLTEGEAKADPALKSHEFNSKGEIPEIGARYDETDNALKGSLQSFHREATPSAVGNTDVQNGQGMLDSLKRYDAPKKQAVSDAYKAAKDSNDGSLDLDANGFGDKTAAALKPQGKGRFLPPEIQGIVDDISSAPKGRVSIDDVEGYKTALANAARKAARAGDGNAEAAISIVRDKLTDLQPTGEASSKTVSLYNKARGMAKDRFSEMDQDPAYKAAVEDDTKAGELSDLSDKFSNKYVLNGAKANLQRLRAKLDQEGHEAMTSTAFQELKNKAGVAKDRFHQDGYNTALEKLKQKGVAKELFGDSDTVDKLDQLGRVSKNVQQQTRGSFNNNAHTLVGSLARAAGEGVSHYAADALNTAVPFAKLGDRGLQKMGENSKAARAHRALRPGAGLAQ